MVLINIKKQAYLHPTPNGTEISYVGNAHPTEYLHPDTLHPDTLFPPRGAL